MMRILACLMALFCLTGVGSAELSRLLSFQKKGDSGAYVSSGFHDWRTVSKYRRYPGLHAGYDIAMLANSPVRAAWPGEVVAIVPWYGREFGVTVRSSNGYEATYGHIEPNVSVSDRVEPGDVLGWVVVDHVDVKMRDSAGAFVDFAYLDFGSQATAKRPSDPLSASHKAKQMEAALAELQKEHKKLSLELEQTLAREKMGLVPAKSVRTLEKKLRDLETTLPKDRVKPLPNSFQNAEAPAQPPTDRRPVADRLIRAAHPEDFGRGVTP